MAFDPYDPCPCGSGKKFRWCCQPIYGQINQALKQDSDGQHEAALRTIETLCTQHPGNPEVWGRKAQLLFQGNRVDEAEQALQKAFDINPNYPFGYYLRGSFRRVEGEIAGAVMLFRKAADLYDPAARDVLADLYSLITDCELRLNRPVAARAALEMAGKMDPGNAEIKAGVEQFFTKESKLPTVAGKQYEYRKLPGDASSERRTAWQRALDTASSGKLSDAARAFEQLTAADASDGVAWYNLGLTKAWLGDNAGAVEALDRSVQLDHDEDQAAQAWALAEVLLCGQGLEEQADFVNHMAMFPIRDPNRLIEFLNQLQRDRRLLGMQAREQEGILTAMMLEKVQGLTLEHAASKPARLGAYLMVVSQVVQVWNVDKEMFDATVSDLMNLGAGALGEPQVRILPAHFGEVLNAGLAFAIHAKDEAEGRQRTLDAFRNYMEEKWIHKPVRSLGNMSPQDAVASPALRKKLLGLMLFLADCSAILGWEFDFDVVRRKLGLLADQGAPAATAAPTRDFSSLDAGALAGLDVASLSDDELELAYQSGMKIGAADVAGKLAAALVARPPRADKPDRYPLFNQLVQQALSAGNTDAALDYVNEGEKSDCEHNEGRRRNDYELRRGQVHMKRGEIDQAADVFERLIDRAPAELRFRGTAAETMLSAKQAKKALGFAEGGLKKSREQNNRDSEQYFIELTAAAKKQGG